MADDSNFVLVGQRSALSVGGGGEMSEAPAADLLDFDRTSSPWIAPDLSPVSTWLLADHGSGTAKTLALHLGEGNVPSSGLQMRVRRSTSDPRAVRLALASEVSRVNYGAGEFANIDETDYTPATALATVATPTAEGSTAEMVMDFTALPDDLVVGPKLQMLVMVLRRKSGPYGPGGPTIDFSIENGAGYTLIGSSEVPAEGAYAIRFDGAGLADATAPAQIRIKMEVDPQGSGDTVEVGAVMLVPSYDDGTAVFDSGFVSAAPGTTIATGGEPVDNLGRQRPAHLSYDFRNGQGQSDHQIAQYTLLEYDVGAEPATPATTLDLSMDFGRQFQGFFPTWRYYLEGPGLARMRLKRGIRVTVLDGSSERTTVGEWPRKQIRRVRKKVDFQFGHLPANFGPPEVWELLLRCGNTEPVIMIVLPVDSDIRYAFSIAGYLTGNPGLAHTTGKLTDAKLSITSI